MLRNKNSKRYFDLNSKRRIYSQNFLKDKSLVYRLVENSSITENDTVIEIGPGRGVITKFLLEKAKKVIAIEIDTELVNKLKEKFADKSNLEISNVDIQKYQLPIGDYKVFSNIPFRITSDILKKFLDYNNSPVEAYLIVQIEAARRYIGNPFIRENLTSLIYKPFFDFEIYHEFSPSDFDPSPNVKPVMIRVIKKSEPIIDLENKESYVNFLKYAFLNQKERLSNSLKKIFTFNQFVIMSKNYHFDIKSNASDLNFDQWIGLFSTFLTMVSEEKKAIIKNSPNS